jgi:mono/diheme cytochrome c family protein
MQRCLILALALGLTACAETTLDDVACPPEGTTLTYEGFGRAFLDAHCQSCHGSAAGGRKGAPSGYDFATREDVLLWRARIFSRAAGGNTTMPPGPEGPAASERERLAEWLACGAP